MKPWVKYVLIFLTSFVIGVLSFIGYTYFVDDVYGDGVEIKVDGSSEVTGVTAKLKVVEGGYFKGSLKDIVSDDYDGESPYKGYLVLNAELTGLGDEALEFGGITVVDKDGVLVGKSFAIHTNDDNITNYVSDKEMVKKYNLIGTGDRLYPDDVLKGAVYVETKELKVGNSYEILVPGVEEGITFKLGEESFDESEVLKVYSDKVGVDRDKSLGMLSGGVGTIVSKDIVKYDGIEFGVSEAVLYNEIKEDFHYEIGHLTSFNGSEKVFLANVSFKNGTDKSLVMGKFILERPNGDSIEAVRVVASKDVGNGRLSEKMMGEYGLMSYYGLTNGEVLLDVGKSTEGNVMFHTNDLVTGERVELKYVGVDGKVSEGVSITLTK